MTALLSRRRWAARVATQVAALSLSVAAPLALAAPAAPTLSVYNPGDAGIFPVTSTLITGAHDAVLVDAQFRRQDAQQLVERIRRSGKRLTTVYVSQADPDYYFGLDVIHQAFPAARIVATPQTVAIIRAQMEGKRAYWGPILKADAPRALVLPQPLHADHLSLEGQRIEIKGLRGEQPERSYLWLPALRTVLGGVVVSGPMHVWTADTQTPAARAAWVQTLEDIRALQPRRVIPGHFLGAEPAGLQAVDFTQSYLEAFERAAADAADSSALVQAMLARYPDLAERTSLELSAKVAKGEMTWPQ